MSTPNHNDLKAEISCYSLPFGGLGFTSHLLTYYTLFCLSRGLKPLWPRHRLDCTKRDIFIGLVSLIVSTVLAISTIVKCRRTWPLLVIGVWKLAVSLTNGLMALYAAYIQYMHGSSRFHICHCAKSDLVSGATVLCLIIYIPGMISGLTGLLVLVTKHSHTHGLLPLSAVFLSLTALGIILSVLNLLLRESHLDMRQKAYRLGADAFFGGAAMLSVLAALYSDWALGVMTDNLLGQPTSDNSKFYWAYFAAKRLSMLLG